MTLFTIYVAFGILNATVAYDQDILMISMPRWRRSVGAWVEAVLYVFLWPLQVAYWVYTRLVNAGYWVFARWMS